MKIAVDFDGVICDLGDIYRSHGFNDAPPKRNAITALHWLVEQGHEVWVFTARPIKEFDDIKKWLTKWGFPDLLITDTKTNATIYLDDRAVRFTNWVDFCKLIG